MLLYLVDLACGGRCSGCARRGQPTPCTRCLAGFVYLDHDDGAVTLNGVATRNGVGSLFATGESLLVAKHLVAKGSRHPLVRRLEISQAAVKNWPRAATFSELSA